MQFLLCSGSMDLDMPAQVWSSPSDHSSKRRSSPHNRSRIVSKSEPLLSEVSANKGLISNQTFISSQLIYLSYSRRFGYQATLSHASFGLFCSTLRCDWPIHSNLNKTSIGILRFEYRFSTVYVILCVSFLNEQAELQVFRYAESDATDVFQVKKNCPDTRFKCHIHCVLNLSFSGDACAREQYESHCTSKTVFGDGK
ncbi:hypothetical protein AVEN_122230-1 [Araneus ventricosus]|uniref:Uncharacterized protein n=1 Tax=Araneus ventricosus TaxID=182803 RepID=A0A4Y2KKT6_ARAVE|nr:hypothetical protein AVEN_122230-1 [Araneus ventricosus]